MRHVTLWFSTLDNSPTRSDAPKNLLKGLVSYTNWFVRKSGTPNFNGLYHSHMLHVRNIYLHLGYFGGVIVANVFDHLSKIVV